MTNNQVTTIGQAMTNDQSTTNQWPLYDQIKKTTTKGEIKTRKKQRRKNVIKDKHVNDYVKIVITGVIDVEVT